jgi:hypothetical protein
MSETISVELASTRLPELIHSLGPTDEIVLTENENVARGLYQQHSGRPPRVPGLLKGKLTIISYDDDHLADFKDYMP